MTHMFSVQYLYQTDWMLQRCNTDVARNLDFAYAFIRSMKLKDIVNLIDRKHESIHQHKIQCKLHCLENQS
jgi:hypothetical protein